MRNRWGNHGCYSACPSREIYIDVDIDAVAGWVDDDEVLGETVLVAVKVTVGNAETDSDTVADAESFVVALGDGVVVSEGVEEMEGLAVAVAVIDADPVDVTVIDAEVDVGRDA